MNYMTVHLCKVLTRYAQMLALASEDAANHFGLPLWDFVEEGLRYRVNDIALNLAEVEGYRLRLPVL